MGAALVLVFVVLAAAGAFGLAGVQRQGHRNFLAYLARSMGGTSTTNSVSATRNGVATTLSFETRGAGSSSERWTYVDCALPPGYPFTLHLDRHGRFDAAKIERGEMIDVVVGDPAFDRTFRVEGAPAEVVRRVLTAPVRQYLTARSRADLSMQPGPALRLAVHGWLDHVETVMAAVDCASAIAGGVRAASLAVDAEIAPVDDGPAYRAIASDAPLQEARAARAAEVAKVEAVRASRVAGQKLVVWAVLVVLVLVFIMIIASH